MKYTQNSGGEMYWKSGHFGKIQSSEKNIKQNLRAMDHDTVNWIKTVSDPFSWNVFLPWFVLYLKCVNK
jgi:hypothetical protein